MGGKRSAMARRAVELIVTVCCWLLAGRTAISLDSIEGFLLGRLHIKIFDDEAFEGKRLVSVHLSSANSFLKYQKFTTQITVFKTFCKRSLLVSDRDHFCG